MTKLTTQGPGSVSQVKRLLGTMAPTKGGQVVPAEEIQHEECKGGQGEV
jgi:hypothetical protein